MNGRRWIAGLGLGAIIAAGTALAPALGAPQDNVTVRTAQVDRAPVMAFTPVAADPKLAAMIERSTMSQGSFRFTPSEGRKQDAAMTVAVRASALRSSRPVDRVATTPTPTAGAVSVAPIAYSLGTSVGWTRFALVGDLGRLDASSKSGRGDVAALGASFTSRRAPGRIKSVTDRGGPDNARLMADPTNDMIDVGGAYSLSRNIDVTAGVRYKSDKDRIVRDANERRDNQAVYVGTAFRF